MLGVWAKIGHEFGDVDLQFASIHNNAVEQSLKIGLELGDVDISSPTNRKDTVNEETVNDWDSVIWTSVPHQIAKRQSMKMHTMFGVRLCRHQLPIKAQRCRQ